MESHSEGLPLKYCADIVGVDRRTIYNWMEKGEKAKSGKYREFYIDMQKARAKFILHHQRKIANSPSWMASQYLLQCVDSEFVVAEKQQIEAETKATIQAEVDMTDPRIQAQDLAMLKELIGDKDDNSGGDKPTTK